MNLLRLIGIGVHVMPEETASVGDITTQMGTLLTSVLGWITSIYTWVIGEPLIIFFLAIGLTGAIIRWARKLVHF